MKNAAFSLSLATLLALVSPSVAHPLPDVAVRANFEQNGDWMLQVEIDPRSFEPDPNVAPYLTNADLEVTAQDRRDKFKATAADYLKRVVEVVLDPAAELKPEFAWEFTGMENAPLKAPEDPVMLTGTWRGKIPEGTTGYSIKALPEGTLSVLYHNTALGKKVERYQILFPGENSYVLDLKTFKPRTEAPPPITADSVDNSAAASGDLMCPMCETGAGGSYTLPVVASVAGLVIIVTLLRKKRVP
ncbi:hypothetical protein [Prosthecobacter sp.]|uniref:hypothetical protein n=1 Tax=Prosthecobacter sp. TaxID=1965333 RepID=UPI001D5D3312|nr:hypothetical protein [Prosthecobacter sp.]MCB1278020.1 hypothetical protein [Prosthecobacter sp.]